jgi:hypothetical protein
LVGNRVEIELAGEEILRPVSERSRLVAAVEVQLECVDPSKRSCVEPIEVRRYGLPTLVSRSRSDWSVGLNWTESPSGANPDGLPAGVRPTR